MSIKISTIVLFAYKARAIDNSLSDCLATAALFDNTCSSTSTPVDIASHAGSEMSCIGTMSCPEGSVQATYTSGNPCTWTRKLCVTCADVSGVTEMRIQTNALPNHCFNSLLSAPSPTDYDYTMVYNPDVSSSALNYSAADIDTANETSELLCDLQRTSSANFPSTSTLTNNLGRRRLQPPCHPNCGDGPPPGGDG